MGPHGCTAAHRPAVPSARAVNNASSHTFVAKCNLTDCGLLLPYGSGTVIGELSIDTVVVGAQSLPGTTFGRVFIEPGPLEEWGAPVMDGALPLARPWGLAHARNTQNTHASQVPDAAVGGCPLTSHS